MKCQNNEEHNFQVHIDKDKILEIKLCYKCSHDLIRLFFENINELNNYSTSPCPKCGHTEELFILTQKLGCPHCYSHFSVQMDIFNQFFHQNTKHVGKKPKNQQNKEDKIKTLKLYLAQAKEHENYEKAAELVTEIRNLERQ
jgi:protein-arginine kinase activator protein McsA